MTACDIPGAKPDDMDEFLDRVGSKAPQPKSAAQVRSIVDKIKGRVREPTEKAYNDFSAEYHQTGQEMRGIL